MEGCKDSDKGDCFIFIFIFIFVIGKEENRKVGECKDSDKGGCLPRMGCTCQLPGLHKVYHDDDDDTYLYHYMFVRFLFIPKKVSYGPMRCDSRKMSTFSGRR